MSKILLMEEIPNNQPGMVLKTLVDNGIFDKFTISTGELISDFWLPSTYQLNTSTAPVKLHQVQDGIWTTKAMQDGHQILEVGVFTWGFLLHLAVTPPNGG